MVKRELQTGMLVKLRRYTDLYVIMRSVGFGEFRHQDLIVNKSGWMPLDVYKDDMSYPGDSDFDIVEVWRPIQQASLRISCGDSNRVFKDDYKQIYVREDKITNEPDCTVVEMTLKEIEQALGRKIKVVSDESEKSVVSSEVSSTDV